MEKYYVYFEHLLLINLLLNYLILWLTSRFLQLPTSKKKLLAGALIGAAYTFLILLPIWVGWLNLIGKVVVSLIMVKVAIGTATWRQFAQSVLTMYFITFLLGGTLFGLSYFLQETSLGGYVRSLALINENFFILLIFLCGAVWLLGRFGPIVLKQSKLQAFLRTKLTITVADQSIQVDALLDTGNRLRDPISQCPVIIVEYEAVKDLLPKEMVKALSQPQLDFTNTLQEIEQSPWANRFRVIPFKSLGKEQGLLIGFRPEGLKVTKGENELEIGEVIVGISPQRLSLKGNYQALMHPELLQL